MRIPLIILAVLLSPTSFAQQTGESWEFTIQTSGEDGRLGPAQTQKLCFPKGKDMKEPPEKDPSCKTTVQHSGKKSTFRSVCKDSDVIITSTGFTEELGANHFRSDITIVTEEKGRKTQQRQVGSIKKLPGSCNPNNFMGSFQPPAMSSEPPPKSTPSARGNNPKPDAQSTAAASEEPKDSSSEQAPDQKSILETGKDALRGLFRF